MALKIVKGDATRPTGEGQKIIVHCVNDIGLWGAGFVVALSRRWPEPEQEYRSLFGGRGLVLGHAQIVRVSSDICVANVVGQSGVRSARNPRPVKYDALERGLNLVAEEARDSDASIHMPRIACGLAGGTWDRVSAIVESVMSDLDVTVYDL